MLEGIFRLGLLWWPGPWRASRAKLSVNRGKLQAVFACQRPVDDASVTVTDADLKIPPDSPNFRLFRHYSYELEMHA
jgi:hypothetical protein